MPESNLFKKFINSLQFDVSDYLDTEITEDQDKMIDEATFIFEDNIVGDIKKLGGNLKKNKDKFDRYINEAQSKLEDDEYQENAKQLSKRFKEYSKKLKEVISKTCVAIIPVKEMPLIDVTFRTVPRIKINDDSIELIGNGIAYYGEIKCVISRTTIFGKIKGEEPLFAPFMGELDLKGYEISNSDKEKPKSLIHSYISAIIDSLDASSTRNQLGKYHEGYQRHGEPICDFLMKKDQLLGAMKKVHSGLESGRISSDIAVQAIAIPFSKSNNSLVLVTEDNDDAKGFSRCFEGLLRFSASCCEASNIIKRTPVEETEELTRQSAALRTPGGQELKQWTEDELAEEARKREPALPPGMDVWTEEDLQKDAEERSRGIPEGMEVWTEEELTELAKKRQGGLDMPEWTPDEGLTECAKCGYALRRGWSECPICGTPVESKKHPEANSSPEQETKQKADDDEASQD
ncbi:MAG: hypothetical protein EU539_06540 [Promethearchaeota archaeon]|nr:MAG: hypothetical protein EU539_06540 [Candidatus Lokiarchaeota archaeon]